MIKQFIFNLSTFTTLIFLGLGFGSTSFASELDDISKMELDFATSAHRWRIPLPLLKTIGYIESGWHQRLPGLAPSHAEERVKHFGVMGLLDDSEKVLGDIPSIQNASQLIRNSHVPNSDNINPQDLLLSPAANIEGAALVLKHFRNTQMEKNGPITEERLKAWETQPMKWVEVVRRYYTSRHKKNENAIFDSSNAYLEEIYKTMKEGQPASNEKVSDGVRIESVTGINIDPSWEAHHGPELILADSAVSNLKHDECKNLGIIHHPSIRRGYDVREDFKPKMIVIHATDGMFQGDLSTLTETKNSAHYLINKDGRIYQLVDPSHEAHQMAHHAKNYNYYAVGIEHTGFENQPGQFTRKQYESSGRLVRCLKKKLGIEVANTDTVFPHGYWMMEQYKNSTLRKELKKIPRRNHQEQDHTDPGVFWRWDLYYKFIEGDDHAFDNFDQNDRTRKYREFKYLGEKNGCSKKPATRCPAA